MAHSDLADFSPGCIFPTPPSNIQHINSPPKYWDASANKIIFFGTGAPYNSYRYRGSPPPFPPCENGGMLHVERPNQDPKHVPIQLVCIQPKKHGSSRI